jgi:hypothetical protein
VVDDVTKVIPEDHYNAVLAEIIVSSKVGLEHLLLVGEVIVAQARLSLRIQGEKGISLDGRADLTERVLDLEEAYQRAWRAIPDEFGTEWPVRELRELEDALRDAAKGIVQLIPGDGLSG